MIINIDRKFFYQLENGTDFSLNIGDFTSIIKGGVGELIKDISTVRIRIDSKVSVVNIFTISDINAGTEESISRTSGSFINDGWLTGDTFDFVELGPITTAGVVTAVTDTQLLVTGLNTKIGVYDNSTNVFIVLTQSLTELNFQYTLNEDTLNLDIDSITGSTQQYKNNNVGTAFTNSNARSPLYWLTQLTTPFQIKSLPTIDTYTQVFEYEHVFLIDQFYQEGEEVNQQALNPPDRFKNGTLRYLSFFTAGSAENAGATRILDLPISGNDSIGWDNDNFNGGENQYELLSKSLTVGGDIVTGLEVTDTTTCTFVIEATGTTFLTTDPIVIFISYQPNANIYTSGNGIGSKETMKSIWMQESLRQTIDSAFVDGTIITNLTAVLDSPTQITVSFNVDYSTDQQGRLIETDSYKITAHVEQSSLTNNTSNRVPLLLDSGSYLKDQDIKGLISFDEANYFSHGDIFSKGTFDGTTNITLANEDIFLSAYRFSIATKTDELVSIVAVKAQIIVYNTTTDEFWVQNEYSLPVPRGVQIDTLGQLRHIVDIETEREFPLKTGGDFLLVEIDTDNYVGPNQFYNIYVAQQIPYNEDVANDNVDDSFYDNAQPNNNLNDKISNYSGVGDWVVRIALVVTANYQGINTEYMHMSANSTVADYEESTYTANITTTDLVPNTLDGRLLLLENSNINVVYDDNSIKSDIADFDSITRIRKESSNSLIELSSLIEAPNGQVLIGITDIFLLDKLIESSKFATKCLSVGNLLQNTTYIISARLYDMNQFFSSKSTDFDGVLESVIHGNDSSLDFGRNNAFSITFWYKGPDGTAGFASKSPLGGTESGYVVRSSTARLTFALVGTNGSSWTRREVSDSGYNDGNWHNIMVTYDGSDNISGMKIYFDGVIRGLANIVNTLSAPINNVDPFRFARTRFSLTDGLMDAAGVWNKELSQSEVTDIYGSGCPINYATHSANANLVLWNRMGEGATFGISSWSYPDDSGTGNVGNGVNQEFGDVTTDTPC